MAVSKVGSEFLVNTIVAGYQNNPAITGLDGGGFVVTWTDPSETLGDNYGYSIKAQIYNANGVQVGTEFLVNSITAGYEYVSDVARLSGGGFVVTWQDDSGTLGDNSGHSIKARVFGADGTPLAGEFLVNTQIAVDQVNAAVTGLANGGFVVSWDDFSLTLGDDNGGAVKAQVFAANGTKVGGEFLVNTRTNNTQYQSDITALTNGNFVVSWTDASGAAGDNSGTGIIAQIYNASGAKVGTAFVVNTSTTYQQDKPTITGLTGGGFVVSWQDYSGVLGDPDTPGIKAQVFGADGTKVGSEFLVNTQITSAQEVPQITSLANGGFVVTWQDSSGTLGDNSGSSIKAQAYTAIGTKDGGEFLVNTQTGSGQYNPTIAGLAGGGFVVSWQDFSGTLGDTDSGIKAQIFGLSNAPVINSNGGGAAASVSIAENTTAVTTVQATDADAGTTLTYSVSGTDAALFDINSSTGALSFKTAPNFEAAGDAGTNNVYDVVVTASDGTASDTQAIAITIVNDDETPRTGQFQVPTNTQPGSGKSGGTITTLANGNYVVTWDASFSDGDGSDSGIKAQIFGPAGNKIGSEFLVNTSALGIQNQPSVGALANGGFVISWTDRNGDADSWGVKAQVFGPVGTKVGGEFLVNTQQSSLQLDSQPTGLANGGFVVTWNDVSGLGDNSGTSVMAQLYSATGAKVGGEFVASTTTSSDQYYPTITSLDGGGFAIAWSDGSGLGGDDTGFSVKANIFTAAGAKVGSEILVNTVTANSQVNPTITGLAGGGFIVSWQDYSGVGGDASGSGIKAQIFGADGAKVGGEFLVNTQTTQEQNNPAISRLAGGGFVVAWQTHDGAGDGSGTSIKAQLFGATGAKVGGEFRVNTIIDGNQTEPKVTGLPNGDYVITWMDSARSSIEARTFSVPNAPVITSNGGGDTAALSIAENTTAVTTVQATDVDANTTLTYSVSGTDAALFNISSSTGALTFKTAPNFEAAGDAGANNVYDVVVTASDGTVTDTQAIAVTVTNVNDAPVINSNGAGATANVSVAENSTAVTTVVAGDADGNTVTYSITGGADAAKFQIDAQTGALVFVSAPNFETATDAGTNNVYDVVVTASDGTLTDTQAIAVTVTNVNEAPVISSNGGGASAAVTIAENTTAVTSVAASDVDAGTTLTYSITGGADQAKFQIDAATGVLSFRSAADFDARLDANGDNVYDLVVTASDGALTDTQAIAVTLTNIDEAPVITSNSGGVTAAVSVAEGATAVTTVVASDPEAATVAYAISGGVDAALFAIDTVTGALRFIGAPDFETRADAGANSVYDVIVTASDGTLTDTQAIAVTVTNVNEAPVIGSDGGGASASIAIAENSTAVSTVQAADVDAGASVTYSITGGADQFKFQIDAQTGALSFVNAPNFEAKLDANGDNVYNLTVTASDGTLSDTQAIAVTVTDVDENPAITSNNGGDTAAVSIAENTTAVTTVAASDPEGATTAYSITGGADAALFQIDSATGALRFIAAPDFETKADAGTNNVYDVIVTASDGGKTDTQAIAVTVTNANEAAVITSNGGGGSANITVSENGATVTTVAATDPDAGTTLTYSIFGGIDGNRFNIDAQTGVLSFKAAPNFEAPTDAGQDNVYDVVVVAMDGVLGDLQVLAVTVTNVNEAPVITAGGGGASATASIAENTTAVTTVAASDVDASTVLAYSISGGADAALFQIDAVTGAISFKAAPNFEVPGDAGGNNVYDLIVTASDGLLIDTQSVAVTVTDANDAPVIGSNGGGTSTGVSVAENSTAVAIVAATDADPGTTVTYSIVGGADELKFQIDAQTGALSFKSAPNFEAKLDAGGNNVYEVIVSASDGSLTDTQAIAVTVTNVNEAPVITSGGGGASAAVSVSENGTAVTTVVAGDVDAGTTLTYTITGGADAALFEIDQATGALTFKSALDFETPADADGNNVFDLSVTVSDGALSDVQTLAVTLTNVNEGPEITSNGAGAPAALIVDEKVPVITQVTATDVDAATTLTYSIDGGADAALFAIDAATGELRFVTQPNVETPADAGGDNFYDVVVKVSDGALSDTQALSVEVWRIINGTPAIDTLNGTAGNDHIFGFASDDKLNGLVGDDFLDGGAGIDTLSGGLGNDSYYVDNSRDKVIEDAGAGTDTVFAGIAGYQLSTTLENLTFTVGGAHSGLGNALGNVMTGNTGSDNLRGLGGNDRLFGQDGKDTLAGGDGNDRIDGGAGADSMSGGAGDDIFIVDNTSDKAVEGNNQGTDTVLASATFALKSNIEVLTLTGTGAINGTGNRLDNEITGNGAANILNGSTGNDTLSGGLGNDTLIGGKGTDQFVFDSLPSGLTNVDLVRDFSKVEADLIVLSKAVFAALGALGSLSQAEFFAGAGASAAQDADDRIVYDTASGKLYYDADGLGGVDSVQFATIGATLHPGLALANFEIIA